MVLLSAEAEKQLRVWTQAAEGEFSCFGVTELDTDSGTITVQKFFLPEQICTSVHTSPNKEAMGALMTDLVREGYSMENLRCWTHSHADMECFWSSEDTDTIEQMDNDDWLVSIVVNKAGHFRARLDLYNPWRITVDKIKVGSLASIEYDNKLEAELKDKVSNGSVGLFGWPNRQALTDFGVDDYSYLDPDVGMIDEIFIARKAPWAEYKKLIGAVKSEADANEMLVQKFLVHPKPDFESMQTTWDPGLVVTLAQQIQKGLGFTQGATLKNL